MFTTKKKQCFLRSKKKEIQQGKKNNGEKYIDLNVVKPPAGFSSLPINIYFPVNLFETRCSKKTLQSGVSICILFIIMVIRLK